MYGEKRWGRSDNWAKKKKAFLSANSGWENRLEQLVRGEIRFHEPLNLTQNSMHYGGYVDAMVFPADREDLSQIVKFAQENHVPWLVLGMGSQVWLKNEDIQGIVLRLNRTFARVHVLDETARDVLLEVEAGMTFSKLVEYGHQMGLKQIKFLEDLSGSVGGALCLNAETPEGKVRDILVGITVMLSDGTQRIYPAQELIFEYRRLRLPHRGIILSGIFRFKKGNPGKGQVKNVPYLKDMEAGGGFL